MLFLVPPNHLQLERADGTHNIHATVPQYAHGLAVGSNSGEDSGSETTLAQAQPL